MNRLNYRLMLMRYSQPLDGCVYTNDIKNGHKQRLRASRSERNYWRLLLIGIAIQKGYDRDSSAALYDAFRWIGNCGGSVFLWNLTV